MSVSFLRDYQMDTVNKTSNGCVINGGVGSGKSRTGLYYYFKENGGAILTYDDHIPMNDPPQDLYIITTAMKRDSCEWDIELSHFLLSTDEKTYIYSNNPVIVDSWNNIKKYKDVKDSFFIFDEDRVTGSGAWVDAFLKISKNNNWIILSATPGDTWEDYIPVFIANGFYKNKTEFLREHAVFSRYTKWPQIEKFINTNRLIRLRDRILINMDFERHTIRHNINVYTEYDLKLYKQVMKLRQDPYNDWEPIQQASGLCYVLRRIVNSDESRIDAILDIVERNNNAIIFYNFNYELEMLRHTFWNDQELATRYEVAEWNGHMHQEIPKSKKWVYLVQYTAGCEGWNCICSNIIIFMSQNYSYKVIEQAAGRIDRMNSPFKDLYYYHLKSRAPIDLAITRALETKKKFNEGRWTTGKG